VGREPSGSFSGGQKPHGVGYPLNLFPVGCVARTTPSERKQENKIKRKKKDRK
jgi:hypothetical protein